MTLSEFRTEMTSYRQAIDAYEKSVKNTNGVIGKLYILYRKFDENERSMADEVIGEWALSEDENLRFDALALINEFKILSTLPILNELVIRLGSSTEPSVIYELKKIVRLIDLLESEIKPA